MNANNNEVEEVASVSDDSVCRWERQFLRRYWLAFPLASYLLLYLVDGYLWAWIGLDASLAKPSWLAPLRFPFVVVVFGSVGLPILWRLLLGWRLPVRGLLVLSLIAAAIATEWVVSRPAVQTTMLYAVRNRNPHDEDFFIREMAGMRMRALQEKRGGGIVFAGSSQMLHGFDFEVIQKAVAPLVVKRRTVAGMFPHRILGSWDALDIGSEDIVVLYLSEYDFRSMTGLDADWFRPIISPKGLAEAWNIFPAEYRAKEWKNWVDLGLASRLELWRSRDLYRQVVERFFGRGRPRITFDAERQMEDHQRVYEGAYTPDSYWNCGFASVKRILELSAERGAQVIILEGTVNPAIQTPESQILHDTAMKRLQVIAQEANASVVTMKEMNLEHPISHWHDGTHLNDVGRSLLTSEFLGHLQNRGWLGPVEGRLQ